MQIKHVNKSVNKFLRREAHDLLTSCSQSYSQALYYLELMASGPGGMRSRVYAKELVQRAKEGLSLGTIYGATGHPVPRAVRVTGNRAEIIISKVAMLAGERIGEAARARDLGTD